MSGSTQRLSAAEFEALLHLVEMAENRLELARAALVDGEPVASLAKAHGCSRTNVYDAVNRILAARVAYNQTAEKMAKIRKAGVQIQEGWEMATLMAPTEMIGRFKAEIAGARLALIEAPAAPPAPGPVKRAARVATSRARPSKKTGAKRGAGKST